MTQHDRNTKDLGGFGVFSLHAFHRGTKVKRIPIPSRYTFAFIVGPSFTFPSCAIVALAFLFSNGSASATTTYVSSNLGTFSGQGYVNGGATASGGTTSTNLTADDITAAGGTAGTGINVISVCGRKF